MAGSRIKEYPDWQAAAEASKQRKAISTDMIKVKGYSKPLHKDVVRELLIVKPEHGDPWFVYRTAPGIRFEEWKCTAGDCDRIKRWKSY